MRKVKLNWKDQIKKKENKTNDIFNLNHTEHHRIEIKIQKKSIPDELKEPDLYDSYLKEKAQQLKNRNRKPVLESD
jgi:hypothetical protein